MMKPKFVKEGEIYGKLTIVKVNVLRNRNNKLVSECKCACGNTKLIANGDITRTKTPRRSCGCGKGNHKHGHSQRKNWSRAYNAWHGMIRRCRLESHVSYKYYGGRGISVCDRWLEFENFLVDMGEPQIGMSIERINVDGNYEPKNCRWATSQEQANNRRTSYFLTYNGRTQTITQWAKELNTSHSTLLVRLKLGWSVEKVLTTPVTTKKRKARTYKEH